MTPSDQSPESPKKGDPSAVPPLPENNGQNGAGAKEFGIWPFDGPQPNKLSPEEWEWVRGLWTDEEEEQAAAGLREILDGKGVSSEEFLRAIEQAARGNG
jgi:hypothetical protein